MSAPKKVEAIAEPFLPNTNTGVRFFFNQLLFTCSPAHLPKADVVSLAGVAAQQAEEERLTVTARGSGPVTTGPLTSGGQGAE